MYEKCGGDWPLFFPTFFKLLFFLTMNSCCVVIFLLFLVSSFSLFVLIHGIMRVSPRKVNRELRINLAIWLLAPSSFSTLLESNEHYLVPWYTFLGRWGTVLKVKVKGVICSPSLKLSLSSSFVIFKEQNLLLCIITWIISCFSSSELPIVWAMKILGLVICHSYSSNFLRFLEPKRILPLLR